MDYQHLVSVVIIIATVLVVWRVMKSGTNTSDSGTVVTGESTASQNGDKNSGSDGVKNDVTPTEAAEATKAPEATETPAPTETPGTNSYSAANSYSNTTADGNPDTGSNGNSDTGSDGNSDTAPSSYYDTTGESGGSCK